jgi:formylglycine-generating enzyme required for sulfatase activity
MSDQPTTILNDKAVESLKEDALDFTPYVHALADIAMTGSTPLTIGVFGTWGSGKTSLMRMVKEQVEAQGAAAGWFDAWKYDKEETLWRAFLLSVLFALEEAAAKNKQPTEEIEKLKTLLYQPIDIEKTGGVTIDLAKLGGKAVQGAVQIGLSFIPGGAALGKIVEELQKSGTANLSEGALDAIQRERIKVHIEQIRFLEQFQERFRRIVAETVVRNNNGRLVVFVDDLDRCLPEKAIEVLEAIKLFVDAPGCVFLLGLDAEVIARGVELRYHDYFKDGDSQKTNPIDGAKYLEKIIQLPFQIPPVEHSDMQDFVGGLSQTWPHPDCPIVFAEGLGNNPRQIKRTVNVFLMLWRLAAKREKKLQGAIKPVRLAKVVALQTAAPLLYDLLKEQPGLLRDLENYYLTEGEQTPKGKPQVAQRPELPDGLARLVEGIPTIKRILTVKHIDKKDTSFGKLSPADLRLYFTLTKRAEAPQSVSAEPARLLFEPQVLLIPAGKFLMGSTKEQAEQAIKDGGVRNFVRRVMINTINKYSVEWEQPQNEVELSAYFIGKYPVTNREYHAYIQETRARPPQGWDGRNYPPEKSDHPVVSVSWRDAQKYCKWLSQKTGKQYRLPSEAEWEKAARGTDGRVYPWGDDFDPKKCNVNQSKIGSTTPVGQFSQAGGDSPYSCADMAGNVWEWCADWSAENEYKNRVGQAVKDPPGPQKGVIRVLRGGAWNYSRYFARCACRYWGVPEGFLNDIGFRLVRSPSSPISES